MHKCAVVIALSLSLPLAVEAQSGPVVYTGPGATDSFVAANVGATVVSVGKSSVTYKTVRGPVLLSGPYLTYQDASGKWQITKPQIASDTAGGWKQSGAPIDISLVGGGASKHLKIGK